MIQATILNLFKKKELLDKKNNYYNNGEEDDYADIQERLINNSVTAKTASNKMMQYIIGKGYGEIGETIVNKDKNLTIYNIANRLIKSKVRQRGAFVHVKYNMNYEIASLDVLPFQNCKVGKKDDKEYSGKILYSKDFSDSNSKKQTFDTYNRDVGVIESQVRKACGNKEKQLTPSDFSQYKGQLLYINDDYESVYPLSRIDAVQNDCDSETQSSIYKNRSLRKGSFGKTVFITPPLIGDDIQKTIFDENGNQVRNPLYITAESERDAFKNTVESFFGAENTGEGVLLETQYAGEDIEKAFVIKNYQSNINDKMFEFTENSVRRNILFAFNDLPLILVEPSEGVFSNSGETLKEGKRSYWENNEMERNSIESTMNDLLSNFNGNEIKIQTIPLIVEKPLEL